MAERSPRRKRKKTAEPSTRGLAPRDVCAEGAPAAIRALARSVEEDGGGVIGSYRDPLGSED